MPKLKSGPSATSAAPPHQASPRKAGTCSPPEATIPTPSFPVTYLGRKGRTGVVSLSVLRRSWPPRSHSHFLVLINKRGEVEGAGRSEGRGGVGWGETKWLLVNPEPASGAAELRRAGRAEARRAMQVHAPPSARGGAPPAFPGFVLGPWPRLAPAEEDAASSPEYASGAPGPLRGCHPAGSKRAPRSLPGRARRRRRAAPSPGVGRSRPEAADAVVRSRCCES